MSHKKSDGERMKVLSITIPTDVVIRIDAVAPENGRSLQIREWIMAGLSKAEQNRNPRSKAYDLLGGEQ